MRLLSLERAELSIPHVEGDVLAQDFVGVVRGYDEEKGRYVVQLQGGASMKIKPDNLKPASAAQAQSMGGGGGAPMPSVAEVEGKLRGMSVGQLRCA